MGREAIERADVVDASICVTGSAFVADPMTSEVICLHVSICGVANVLAGAVEPCTAYVTCNAVVLSVPCDREVTRTAGVDCAAVANTTTAVI